MKKRVFSALSALLILCVLTMSVYAVEVPDLNRLGSISIHMSYDGEAVPGGSLTLYQVADVHVENTADYSFQLLDPYKDSQVSLENIGSVQTALDLAAYTQENGITGVTAQIDENGNVSFADLPLGLYLLVQEEAAEGYSLSNPFLVSVPGKDGEVYIYEVDASPKLQLEPVPTEPTQPTEPTDPTKPPDIPYTGQNNLPIPVLLTLGLGLCVVGVVIRRTGKKYEK